MRIRAIVFSLALLLSVAACGVPAGTYFYGSLGLGEPRIVVSTSNAGALTVLLYDLEGNLMHVVADFTGSNDTPKGIAPFDNLSFAVLLDGADRISRLSLVGEPPVDFVINANLTGNLWQMAFDDDRSRYFAIETNTIEAFDRSGERVGAPYIAATVGSCVLTTPRGLTYAGGGLLISTATGNDDINVYDVSESVPTCVRANTTFGNVDPTAVLAHSNGLLYVATQGDDRVYSFSGDGSGTGTVVWGTNTAVLGNPTALLEMPDGALLVASDLTNSVVRLDTDGNYQGTFLRDAFTGAVTQMLLIDGQ